MKKTITQDEWLAAYEAAMKGDPGESASEIADKLDREHTLVYHWLERMVRNGKATQGWAMRFGKRVRVYQLKGAK